MGIFWGKKFFQPVFEKLFFFSLKGMNIGGGSFVSDSGEAFVLKTFFQSFWQGKKDLVVFDAGANLGEYALTAVKLMQAHKISGKIFAFEPAAQTFAKLEKNIASYEQSLANGDLPSPFGAHSWLGALSKIYTMPEQHAAHSGKSASGHAHSASSATPEITFF